MGKKLDKSVTRYALMSVPLILGVATYDIQRTLSSSENDVSDFYNLGYRLAAYSAIYPLILISLFYFRRKSLDSSKKEKVKQILSEISSHETPDISVQKNFEVKFGVRDYFYTSFLGGSSEALFRKLDKWYGLKTKNPLFLSSAAIGYFKKNEFDEGLNCLRDIADLCDDTLPKCSMLLKVGDPIARFGDELTQLDAPFSPESYLKKAVTYVLSKPEEVWKWTKASAEVAKEFEKDKYAHYLVLHALFSTAQRRSDEQESWGNALSELEKSVEKQYLGESQNPVWTPKGNFFKNTLVIKGDKERENLQKEVNGAKTLDKILEKSKAPRPLFISNVSINGNYVYLMRTAQGETLYDLLQKGQKSRMSEVDNILAQIHARYPLDGLTRLDLEQKINKKTKDLKLDEDFSNDLILTTKPVRQAIIETGTWKAGKDAHPENWILSHAVHPIDTLFKEIQPTSLDLANLYNYGEHFTPEQKRQRIMNYISSFNKFERTEKPLQIIFREYWNAEIQRAIDLTAAWMTPKRKTRHPHIIPLLERAQLSIQNLKHDDLMYYEKNEAEYTRLNMLIDKLKEHVTPYIS